ncbi:metallophosphoesterase [Tissierella sp.]|uniref:metallophosphoesterase n=1 Tax=Tissierella sp. TaxID=41274 RepID=UPI0030738122
MRIILCHLSDIHFKLDKKNSLLDKEEKLSEAIRSHIQMVSSNNLENRIFFIITGDIAFSGKSEEYDIALNFIIKLQDKLKEELGEVNIEYIIAPGNHDCNFEKDNALRQMALDGTKNGKKVDNHVINLCTSLQENFDNFTSILNEKHQSNKIQNIYEYETKDKKIAFQTFNSSWMSMKRESQGDIIIPLDQVDEIYLENYDLVVTLFHHPLNWIENNNKIKFKQLIEKTSDIIITGHEHNSETIESITNNRYSNEYIAGGELQDTNNDLNSRFNFLTIDLSEKKKLSDEYYWDGNMYIPKTQNNEWTNFVRNKYIDSKRVCINDRFREYLNDLGVKLTKAGKDTIYLKDIYVYPNLEIIPRKKTKEKELVKKEQIKSIDTQEFVLDSNRLLLLGEEKSGKTALGKITFDNLLERDIIPILVNGRDLKFSNEFNFKKTIHKIFLEQYSEENLEKYIQFSKKQKAIIIDDFHKIPLVNKGRGIILSILEGMFDKIILFMEDDLMLQEIMGDRELNLYLEKYDKYKIREFGFSLRSELIRKWNYIGIDHLENGTLDIDNKCIEMEKKIDIAIGNNLLPKYPVYVLLILQQFETKKNLDTSVSTYGYLYEFLITKQLSTINKNIDDVNMNATYLSELAYYMFDRQLIGVGMDDIEEVTKIYNEKYTMKLSSEILKDKYIDSEIISADADKYKFRYKYIYYYFVAKYIKEEINSEIIKEHITNMTGKLYNEDYANIILFLCHLTKENYVINEILNNAKQIFKDFEPYDLNEHKVFIKSMYSRVSELVYPNSEPEENRRALLESKDEIATSNEELDKDDYEESDEEIEDINNMMELNRAYKTIQILGQIVKNFPGSLIGSIKHDIILECYHLGLRTLNVFMSIINENIKDMIEELKMRYKEKNLDKPYDEQAVEEDAKYFILRISEAITISIIKKISESVNNNKLSETYKEIILKNNTISFKIIDISIKLDFLRDVPESEIIRLNEELKNNYFTQNILRHLVFINFYLYRHEHRVKQRICSKLGISYKSVQVKEGKNRELNSIS